jgi:hypothetical protein
MGTAVAHDALHHLGTESWLTALKGARFEDEDATEAETDRKMYLEGLENVQEATHRQMPFSPSHFAFQSITMLSNVSGLIHGAESPYHSIVRPGTPGDMGAFAVNYFNVNHRFDPISAIGDFKMPAAWAFGGGRDIRLDHVMDQIKDIHDAAHYVLHPDVHLRLLVQYVDDYAPSDEDVNQIAVFNKKHGLRSLDKNAKSALEALKNGDEGPLSDLIKRLKSLMGRDQ